MNHSGQLPPGQSGYGGQPQPQQQPQQQQQQQYAGYQQQAHPHQFPQQQQQYAFPSQEMGGFRSGGYDATGFGEVAQPQHQQQQQFQQQNQWAFYNSNNGYSASGNGGIQMPAQAGQYMDAQGVWRQAPQPQAQRPQPQQSYQVPSPQMQNVMDTQAHYGAQGSYSMPMQQPPLRSPSVTQQRQQQQMRQRPSPQVQHQPSPHVQHQPSPQLQHQPSPQLQQQQFALNSQQSYQPMQSQQGSRQPMQSYPQQTQPSPRVHHQQAQINTPPLTQQKPQVLQPRPNQSQPQPSPQVKLEAKHVSAPTSFHGQSPSTGQARPLQPLPPAQSLTQTRPVPSLHPSSQSRSHPQPQPQPSAAPHFAASPTTPSPHLQQQQAPNQSLVSVEEQHEFVNLQDIQAMPRPKPASAAPAPRKTSASKQASPQDTLVSSQKSLQSPAPIKKKSPSGTPHIATVPLTSKSKVAKSSSNSVSQSPITPSGKLSTSQSPAVPTKAGPINNASVMIAAGEQMISQARSATSAIAANPQSSEVDEYQKMISIGLACLETALQRKGLTPKQEARVRLRYAAILHEETENITLAETTLVKGIALCDKHRLHDLKYCMQYLMMKVLFLRNRKAGLRALDQHIADCDTYGHIHWSYSFRLLKASFYEESGNAADAPAFDNMRSIQSLASSRGDVALSVYASLSEALMLLKTPKASQEAVRSCLAQASKYQLDEQAKLPQLEVMFLLLDVAAGLHRESYSALDERLRELQKKIDNSRSISKHGDFLMPIKRPSSAGQPISAETSAIIRPGEPEASDTDYLVMVFMNQAEIASVVFSLVGLTFMHKHQAKQQITLSLWQNGLKQLTKLNQDSVTTNKPARLSLPLKQAIEQREWRTRMQCFYNMLLALYSASSCKWDSVRKSIQEVEEAAPEGLGGSLRAYYFYLKGVYHQGTGDFGTALAFFQDSSLSHTTKQTNSTAQQHLALLAGINRIWIMQRPQGADDWPYANDALTLELIDELDPICTEHHVQEIRTAWWVVRSTAVVNPPLSRNERKTFAAKALHASKQSENIFAKLVSTLVARDLLYTSVQSEQAAKCVNSAGVWSKRSANPLWQSVAAGIFADFTEGKGERDRAQAYYDQGIKAAQTAFKHSS